MLVKALPKTTLVLRYFSNLSDTCFWFQYQMLLDKYDNRDLVSVMHCYNVVVGSFFVILKRSLVLDQTFSCIRLVECQFLSVL